jgi:hypothetical protein
MAQKKPGPRANSAIFDDIINDGIKKDVDIFKHNDVFDHFEKLGVSGEQLYGICKNTVKKPNGKLYEKGWFTGCMSGKIRPSFEQIDKFNDCLEKLLLHFRKGLKKGTFKPMKNSRFAKRVWEAEQHILFQMVGYRGPDNENRINIYRKGLDAAQKADDSLVGLVFSGDKKVDDKYYKELEWRQEQQKKIEAKEAEKKSKMKKGLNLPALLGMTDEEYEDYEADLVAQRLDDSLMSEILNEIKEERKKKPSVFIPDFDKMKADEAENQKRLKEEEFKIEIESINIKKNK